MLVKWFKNSFQVWNKEIINWKTKYWLAKKIRLLQRFVKGQQTLHLSGRPSHRVSNPDDKFKWFENNIGTVFNYAIGK